MPPIDPAVVRAAALREMLTQSEAESLIKLHELLWDQADINIWAELGYMREVNPGHALRYMRLARFGAAYLAMVAQEQLKNSTTQDSPASTGEAPCP